MNALKRWAVYHYFIKPMFKTGALSEKSLKKFAVWVHGKGIRAFGQKGWIAYSQLIHGKLEYLARQFKL